MGRPIRAGNRPTAPAATELCSAESFTATGSSLHRNSVRHIGAGPERSRRRSPARRPGNHQPGDRQAPSTWNECRRRVSMARQHAPRTQHPCRSGRPATSDCSRTPPIARPAVPSRSVRPTEQLGHRRQVRPDSFPQHRSNCFVDRFRPFSAGHRSRAKVLRLEHR